MCTDDNKTLKLKSRKMATRRGNPPKKLKATNKKVAKKATRILSRKATHAELMNAFCL